jgi:hypothetical protein
MNAEPRYIRGVPHPLPDGEQLLWEGAPSMGAVATHVFHWRLVLAYFVGMLALWGMTTDTPRGTEVWWSEATLRLALGVFVMLCVFGLSRAVASTSWYAITSRRIVMRVGMAFPMSINIPFTLLQTAGLGVFRDGTGQVALGLVPGQRLAYVALWPHCLVWNINHPAPVLRGLEQPEMVAKLLATAVADAAEADLDASVERGASDASARDASSRIERGGSSRPAVRQARTAPAGA